MVDSLIVLHRPEDLAAFSKPEFVIKDYVMAEAGAPAAPGAPVVYSAAKGLAAHKGGHDLNGTPLCTLQARQAISLRTDYAKERYPCVLEVWHIVNNKILHSFTYEHTNERV